MLQPVRLALALALFWGAAPRADAAPRRVKRERPVAVVGNPAEPLPEIRVEAATPTLLFFPTAIAASTLTVDEQPRTVDTAAVPGDGTRIRVLDAGKRSLIVQPVEDLKPGERHELSVVFTVDRASDAGQGLSSQEGVSYRGKGWVLVDVKAVTSVDDAPGRGGGAGSHRQRRGGV